MIPKKVTKSHTVWELCKYDFPEGNPCTDLEDADLSFPCGECIQLLNYKPETLRKALKRIDGYRLLGVNETDPLEFYDKFAHLGMVDIERPEGILLGRFQAVACDDDGCPKCY